MTHGRSDADIVRDTHNTARFFVESPHIAWVLLITTCVAGLFAYDRMPKLKDPRFPVIFAAAVCPWPGVPADRIEELVTRRIEERIAENARVERIESTTRGSGPQARRGHGGRGEGIRRHRPAAVDAAGSARGRRPGRVPEGLRRHLGAPVDGGQPEGGRDRTGRAGAGHPGRDRACAPRVAPGAANLDGGRVPPLDRRRGAGSPARSAGVARPVAGPRPRLPAPGRPGLRGSRLRVDARRRDARERGDGAHPRAAGGVADPPRRVAAGARARHARHPGSARRHRGRQVQLPRPRPLHAVSPRS